MKTFLVKSTSQLATANTFGVSSVNMKENDKRQDKKRKNTKNLIKIMKNTKKIHKIL